MSENFCIFLTYYDAVNMLAYPLIGNEFESITKTREKGYYGSEVISGVSLVDQRLE